MDRNSKSSPPESNQDYDDTTLGPGGFGFGLAVAVFLVAAIIACCSKSKNSQTPTPTPTSLSHRSSGGGASIRREGLDAAVISTFPQYTYAQLKPLKTPSGCAVCLADYKDSEPLRLLPECGHIFHRSCIDPWLLIDPTCPICRRSPLPVAQPAAPVANQ